MQGAVESSSEKNENQLIFDRIMTMSLFPHFFFAHPDYQLRDIGPLLYGNQFSKKCN